MGRIRTLSAATIVVAVQLLVAPAWADDVHVTPSTSGMPAAQTIQKMLSWIAQAARSRKVVWGVLFIVLGVVSTRGDGSPEAAPSGATTSPAATANPAEKTKPDVQ